MINSMKNNMLGGGYAANVQMEKHPFYQELLQYLNKNKVREKKWKCIEIGSGRGALQDIVDDYVGVDFASTVSHYYHKQFVNASATEIPFEDSHFDMAWSYAVWEHIPEPEKAFQEVLRILKNDGHFLFSPAWHCRPWAAQGYTVRPYSDFDMKGKIYKFMIPFLDLLPIRAVSIFPFRLIALVKYKLNNKNFPLIYKKLKANYEIFWTSDSDACNNLDPYFVILWFESRGCKCISHKGVRKFFVRTGTIEIQIKK